MRRIKMRRMLCLYPLVATCLLLGTAGTVGAADVIKLKYSDYYPPTAEQAKHVSQFCDEIKKRTGGIVEITHYAGGTLTTGPRMYDGVIEGVSDLGFAHVDYTPGRFPVTDTLEMPLGFRSAWVGGQVANDFYLKYKPKEWDQVHVLYVHTCGPFLVQTTKKPVSTLDDLKGLKLRATGNIASIANGLGATPVPLQMPDVYEALRRGVLDGVLTTPETLKNFKTGELVKYVSANGLCTGNVAVFYAVMNKDKYNSLSPDLKKIFDQVSEEYRERMLVMWNMIDRDGMEFLKSQGGQVVQLAPGQCEKWAKAVESVVENYKKAQIEKGRSAKEIDDQIVFIGERIKYWSGQEKERGIPMPY